MGYSSLTITESGRECGQCGEYQLWVGFRPIPTQVDNPYISQRYYPYCLSCSCQHPEGCDKPTFRFIKELGLFACSTHYTRWVRDGDLGPGYDLREMQAATDICGTPAGYTRHRRAGEAACDPCLVAWNDYSKDAGERHRRRKGQSVFEPAKCGTPAGYYKHHRDGEEPCDECLLVIRANQRRRRARSKRKLASMFNWVCQLCDGLIPKDAKWPDPMSLVEDHIIPRAKGGGDEPANLQPAHHLCNMQKGDTEGWFRSEPLVNE